MNSDGTFNYWRITGLPVNMKTALHPSHGDTVQSSIIVETLELPPRYLFGSTVVPDPASMG